MKEIVTKNWNKLGKNVFRPDLHSAETGWGTTLLTLLAGIT
jgi:hypothetical protein